MLSPESRIRFHCDRCGRILTATESSSGKLGKCVCGGTILVPLLRHTPTQDNPLRGLVLAGCRIDGVMGKGSAATVYKAHHLALDVPVAIKILHPEEKRSDTPMAQRFLKEARVIARIKHPNIVAVMNAGEEQGYSFIVMQLVVGGSLANVLQKESKISDEWLHSACPGPLRSPSSRPRARNCAWGRETRQYSCHLCRNRDAR